MTRTDAGRDDDCDRLQTFAAAQRGSFRTQIDRVDLYAGPQVEAGVFNVYRKVFEQFAAIASFQAEIVVDGVVDAMKLAADRVRLFEHERVQPQLVTPKRGGQAGWTSTDDDHVMHMMITLCVMPRPPRQAPTATHPKIPFDQKTSRLKSSRYDPSSKVHYHWPR